ncbi:MAG: hypothetical protein EHM48_02455, partial [Planctomycetaceae bacterium]
MSGNNNFLAMINGNAGIDLSGTWQLRFADGGRGASHKRMLADDPQELAKSWNAIVPGCVHMDMLAAGIIKEPSIGMNILDSRWVEECTWYYRREFVISRMVGSRHARLVFENLDLAANIYLNGKKVGSHANSFYPCSIDVTGLIKPGRNVLLVEIESGLRHVADKSVSGYNLANDADLHKRIWLRKTQSSFAWDWSPRLLNVGIAGPVRLEFFDKIRVDQVVVLAEINERLDEGSIKVRIFAENASSSAVKATVQARLLDPSGKVLVAAECKATFAPGAGKTELVMKVDRPMLWWPIGHGEQPLYRVEVVLKSGSRGINREVRQVGFRRVTVNQQPHPESGTNFIIEVNNKRIFCKGGNMVPEDILLARIDRKRIETLIDRAVEANFNFLRVWGGGLYESDDFYELCDRKGIMVWQEFIFACAKYTAHDEQFLNDVRREATFQVRRLASHPSLLVWCGNNEIQLGYYEWGWDKGVVHPDYSLYHLFLPIIVRDEDGTRYYQPSSPISPGIEAPNANDTGDQHPWGLGFHDNDFRKYRQMICRFPNEGGILGAPAMPTVQACLEEGVDRPYSLGWQLHDNHFASWGTAIPAADDMHRQWLGMDIHKMSISDYVYCAGILQGQGLYEYIRNFRRRMFSSASAIFWMYNDVWPCVRSWSVVDYYLRRTPAYWPVKRAMAPLTMAITEENGKVGVYVVNEQGDFAGEVRFGLFALAGGMPLDRTTTICAPANTSTKVAEFDLAIWKKLGEKTHGAFAILSDTTGRQVASDTLMLPLFKDM